MDVRSVNVCMYVSLCGCVHLCDAITVCLSGRLPLLGVCAMSVSVLSSVPSVHGGASSGEVHQPTHQLVCEVQQEEGQGEGRGSVGVGQVVGGGCS